MKAYIVMRVTKTTQTICAIVIVGTQNNIMQEATFIRTVKIPTNDHKSKQNLSELFERRIVDNIYL